MIRIALLIVLTTASLLPSWSVADQTNLTRQQIRSMPMVERPNRPGHFFGNFVRWVYRR